MHTRFELTLYFCMVAHKAACNAAAVKIFFESIYKGIVQGLLMLEVLFTQNFKVEDLSCAALSSSEPSLFFSFWLGTNLFKMTLSITLLD